MEAGKFALALLVVLALCFSVGARLASADLTVAALAITSSGALTLTPATASATVIGATDGTGAITLGASTGTGQTVNVGSGATTGSDVVNIGTGTATTLKTVNIATQAISAVNIGTGAFVNTIAIGSVTTTSTTLIKGGTGSTGTTAATAAIGLSTNTAGTIVVGGPAQTGAIYLGDPASSAVTTVNIATAAQANVVNIGTGAAANVITIGSSSGGLRYYEATEDAAADNTLTAAESGKTLYMGTAGEDQTLPTPANGVVYRFVVQANVATTNMKIQGPAADATDDVIYGSVEVAGAVVLCSAEDTLTFVADTNEAIPGDYVELRSDGTNWYLSGHVSTASAFTCTDAD